MTFDHHHYVPCLRWKQGEYQAVLRLSDQTRQALTPLIEVPEIGFDFERKVQSRTIENHLAPFAKRVRQKWGAHPCFVDLLHLSQNTSMGDGRHPARFVFDDLRALGCVAVPVTGLSRDAAYQKIVKDVVRRDGNGLCLRILLPEAVRSNLKTELDSCLQTLGVSVPQCDLVLDLGAPNFDPISGFSKLVQAIIQKTPYLMQWRTFTVMGTSFPPTMAEVDQGASIIPRSEWLLYKMLVPQLLNAGLRLPTFGDYGISHPSLLEVDMRLVKPSASIRYAIDDGWLIIKGPNVRDNGFGQYQGLCRTIVSSPLYAGAGFSSGDQYISECARGGSTGNLTTWRTVGTSHHLEKVVRDVSSLNGI